MLNLNLNILPMERQNDNSLPGVVFHGKLDPSFIGEVNLDTQSSATLAEELRESCREVKQSLIVRRKKLYL